MHASRACLCTEARLLATGIERRNGCAICPLPGCEVNPWQLPQTQQTFSNPGAKGRWTGIAIEAQVWFTHRTRPPLHAGCELPANCKRLQRTVGAACL